MLLLSHGPIGLKSQALPHSMKRALSKSQGLRIARCQVGIVIIIPYDPAPFFAYSPKESVNLAGSEVPPLRAMVWVKVNWEVDFSKFNPYRA